jgi:hypothetical protein
MFGSQTAVRKWEPVSASLSALESGPSHARVLDLSTSIAAVIVEIGFSAPELSSHADSPAPFAAFSPQEELVQIIAAADMSEIVRPGARKSAEDV